MMKKAIPLLMSALLITACDNNPKIPSDTADPVVSISSSKSKVGSNEAFTLTLKASDETNLKSVTLSADTDNDGDFDDIKTFTSADFKNNTFEKAFDIAGINKTTVYKLVATDAAGNSKDAQTTVQYVVTPPPVDTIAPTVSIASSKNKVGSNEAFTLTLKASDETNLKSVTLSADTDNDGDFDDIKTFTSADFKNNTFEKAFDIAGINKTTVYKLVATDAADNSKDAQTTVQYVVTPTKDEDSKDNPFPVQIGESKTGVIAGKPRDNDYFRFCANKDDRLKISTVAPKGSTLDPYISLYGDGGYPLLERSDGSYEFDDTINAVIRTNIDATACYLVEVTSWKIHNDPDTSDNLSTNYYKLTVEYR